VTLQLGEATKKSKTAFEEQYSPKPEIRHMFRVPEARPPVVISQAFTVACFVPILVLFILVSFGVASVAKYNGFCDLHIAVVVPESFHCRTFVHGAISTFWVMFRGEIRGVRIASRELD